MVAEFEHVKPHWAKGPGLGTRTHDAWGFLQRIASGMLY